MDHGLTDLSATIEEYGWAVRHVGAGSEPDEAPFSYAIGLTGLGHPEVVITGMPFASAQAFLNLVGAMVKEDGRRFRAGTMTHDLTDGAAVAFIAVTQDAELTAVQQIYGQVKRPAAHLVRLARRNALGRRVRQRAAGAAAARPDAADLGDRRH